MAEPLTPYPPAGADLLISAEAIQAALERIAAAITADLGDRNPVVITVMTGGLVFAGQLLPRLPFPLECDYVHVRRYGRGTQGGELQWLAGPHAELSGRSVLLLDDILDEGQTLAAVRKALLERGAREVRIAALTRKERASPPAVEADYVGVAVPDRFVFGFGMDVDGAFRNLPAIYAMGR